MMGLVLTYRDDRHLDHLLEAIRRSSIEILRDGSAFWFRRGRGLVRGSCWRIDAHVPAMYFGFGHPFNPFLWPSDGCLLREIEQTFLANGSSKVDPERLG